MVYALPKVTEYSADGKERFWVEESASMSGWQMILVEKGSFTFEMYGKQQTATAGQVVIFPQGVPFSRKIESELFMHNVIFSFSQSESWLKSHGQYVYGLLQVRPEVVASTCAVLHRAKGLDALPLVDIAVKNLWAHVLLYLEDHPVYREDMVANPTLRKAVEYIREHISERLYVSKVASFFGFTHIKFTKLFTREMGVSPAVYINQERLHHAEALLKDSDFTIGRIATECGFESQFYFHNRFKRKFGVSPSDYRKKIREME